MFHVDHYIEGGLRVCSNGHEQVTKIANRPSYLVLEMWALLSLFNDDPRFTFDLSHSGVSFASLYIYMRKLLQRDFLKDILVVIMELFPGFWNNRF